MKILTILCFVSLFAFNAHADERSSKESVEQLMELTETSKMMDAMQGQISAMFDGMSAQIGISEEERPAFESYMQKVAKLMEKDMGWETFKEPMIKIYLKHFTEEEVKGLISFYQTEVGKSMIEKMPLIMQDSILMSQDLMKGIMPKIQALAVELQKDIEASRKEKMADQ